MSQPDDNGYNILGHKVYFPDGKRPFSSQMAVMCKTLGSLKNFQNALLESPTGTGKSISLLCSSLSWQMSYERDEAEAIQIEEEEETKENIPPPNKDATPIEKRKYYRERNRNKKKKRKRRDPPTIYFATRTHSQIAQIVEELKNLPLSYTSEREPCPLRMAVLSSRKHSCNNFRNERESGGDHTFSHGGSIDDICKNLVENNKCSYYFKAPEVDLEGVWDVEDLMLRSNRCGGCGYHSSKLFFENAHPHLVLCPYSYLIDPTIRKASKINLNNSVVIIDEAHNIEDTAREAASCDLELEELRVVEAEVRGLFNSVKNMTFSERGEDLEVYETLAKVVTGLVEWIDSEIPKMKMKDFEGESQVWEGTEALGIFEEFSNITPDTIELFIEYLRKISTLKNDDILMNGISGRNEEEKSSSLPPTLVLSRSTSMMLISLFETVRLMTSFDLQYLDKYRMVIKKTLEQSRAPKRNWNRRTQQQSWHTTLCLWSMSSGVIFKEVDSMTRSIILTSGTLSPLDSFAAELDIDFPVRLEAGHVIDMEKQVFVGSVGSINGTTLNCVYKNQDTFSFQDGIGEVICQVCENIPNGILVFFSSYGFLYKLLDRWKNCSIFDRMREHKDVYIEPRSSSELDDIMTGYQQSVINNRGVGKKNGALMLAICRGKVSEGINFSDDFARSVLVVGIPYPAFKDTFVRLKREFQDKVSMEEARLLPAAKQCQINGRQWYRQQASRAINQAVGRCIRHRFDFGSILLIDTRFAISENKEQLSRWVRGSVNHHETMDGAISQVNQFFQRINLDPQLMLHAQTMRGNMTFKIEEKSEIKRRIKEEVNVEDKSSIVHYISKMKTPKAKKKKMKEDEEDIKDDSSSKANEPIKTKEDPIQNIDQMLKFNKSDSDFSSSQGIEKDSSTYMERESEGDLSQIDLTGDSDVEQTPKLKEEKRKEEESLVTMKDENWLISLCEDQIPSLMTAFTNHHFHQHDHKIKRVSIRKIPPKLRYLKMLIENQKESFQRMIGKQNNNNNSSSLVERRGRKVCVRVVLPDSTLFQKLPNSFFFEDDWNEKDCTVYRTFRFVNNPEWIVCVLLMAVGPLHFNFVNFCWFLPPFSFYMKIPTSSNYDEDFEDSSSTRRPSELGEDELNWTQSSTSSFSSSKEQQNAPQPFIDLTDEEDQEEFGGDLFETNINRLKRKTNPSSSSSSSSQYFAQCSANSTQDGNQGGKQKKQRRFHNSC